MRPHIKTAVTKLLHRAAAELWHSTVRSQDGRLLDENVACCMQLVLTQELFCCEVMLFGRRCQANLSVASHAERNNHIKGSFSKEVTTQA